MLKVENISTGYGKKQVLDDISFEVNKGEIVLLAGSNGSGKSTLLKAIYGMLPLWNNGQIIFNGDRITGIPTSAILKKGLLYIPQRNNLFEDLTVKENLEMAGLTLDKKTQLERTEQVLSIFYTLTPFLNRTAMKLSGGERQLLTLAMATLYKPKMLLLDEPFAGLSIRNINFTIENIISLKNESDTTFLIVEHKIRECLTIADKVIGLKLGKFFTDKLVNESFNISELNPIFV